MKKSIYRIIGLLLFFSINFFPGDTPADVEEIINNIKSGLEKSEPDLIVKHFDKKTHISLPNKINNFYSVSQSYYILEKFLNEYSYEECHLEIKSSDNAKVSLKGSLKMKFKGQSVNYSLYIAIIKTGDSNKINQFILN